MEITEIIQFWKNSKVNLNNGINLIEINTIEKNLDFKFPHTFKQFYK